MVHSLANDADRRLAEMSLGSTMSHTQPASEAKGRCITIRNQISSRPSRGDKTPLHEQHISIADELGDFSENGDVPAHGAPDQFDSQSIASAEEAEALEEVDLGGVGIQSDSVIAGPLDISDHAGLETLSEIAIEVSAPEQLDTSPEPVPIPTSSDQDQPTASNTTTPEPNPETDEREQQNPRRSRLQIWLDESQPGNVWSSDTNALTTPDTSSQAEKAAEEALSDYSQERSRSVTDLAVSVRGPSSSRGTKVASIFAPSDKLRANPDDDVWDDDINFDNETHVGSFGDVVRGQLATPVNDGKSIPPLSNPTAWQAEAAKLAEQDLREFVESAVYRTNAILRRGSDKQAAKMVRDIQLLVERVLVGETCEERTSFGDELDGSAWRV